MRIAERYLRFKTLFLAVSAMPEAEWSAALQAQCPDDPLLRREVRALLGHHRDESVLAPAGEPRAGSDWFRRRGPAVRRAAQAFGAGAVMLTSVAFNFELRTDSLSRLAVYFGIVAALVLGVSLWRRRAGRAPLPVPAERIGPYEITRLLGMGAMGEVYLARHRALHRRCAVKLIRPEQAGSDETLLRFEREVRALAQLSHPNTVEVYDFGRADDDSYFYVMEYLPGMTLDALVSRHGPLPPGRVVYLLLQVCGALAEAHGKGFVHRDIKPSNIFVCERGGMWDVSKLLDFGLVHVVAQPAGAARARRPRPRPPLGCGLTHAGQILGTPSYIAPEQIGGGAPDARSDLYSLGGVAFFLLAGRPPFESEALSELYAAHLSAPPPSLRELNPAVSTPLERAITRCLHKRPEDRYGSAQEFAAALAAAGCAGEWSAAQAKAWWQDKGGLEGGQGLERL